jgi:competence protein ComEC
MADARREGDGMGPVIAAVAAPTAGDAPSFAPSVPAAPPPAIVPPSPRFHFTGRGMTLLAIVFALGIAIGWQQRSPIVWPWLWAGAGFVAIAACAAVIDRAARLTIVLLLLAMICLGAGWVTLKNDYVAPNDLAALIGDESVLVRLDGVALRGPQSRARTSGSMARFDYRAPATYFPMRVKHLLPRDGEPIAITGAVLVRVDETLLPFRAGDRVQVAGFLLRPAMPRNPGEFDFRQYAKSLGQAGILTVSGRDAVVVTPAPRSALLAALMNWRDQLRQRAGGWLLADLPDASRSERDSLLVSLLLGEREAEIDGFYESFQRVGLAHILAISGFHLAVLAGFVVLLTRLAGLSRRTQGAIVIAIVLLYLLLVEVRMPVLRAGVMTIAASLGLIFGRRLQVSGLVALSAIALLAWRPDELFNPGFQLTYGTVLGLIHLAPPVRRRWFGRPNLEASTSAEMLGQWLRTAVAVSVVAWMVATPIAAYHFGSVALLGIPLSVIAVPLSAVILALGYVKIVLSAGLPSAALLLGVPLTVSAEVLLSIVSAADGLKFSSAHVPPPGMVWTFAALAWVCWWSVGRRHRPRSTQLKWACAAVLALWLTWPVLPVPGRPAPMLRIDMLAVGDGSCYVLRSGGETWLFDAGSSSDLNAGTRSIIPALRHLGVRRVDVIAITHANLDHYSAVLEVTGEFGAKEILLTPHFLKAAEDDPLSPMAYMLSRLVERRVITSVISAGQTRTFGECKIHCLHPPGDSTFERVNNTSMTLRVAAGDRVVLLCGDIQQEAMAVLMGAGSDANLVHADVMELPHHGSHNEVAEAFVERVRPAIIMQSTGWTRWQRDRWSEQLVAMAAERLATVRDGACSVIIERDGSIRIERFLDAGENAGGAEIE